MVYLANAINRADGIHLISADTPADWPITAGTLAAAKVKCTRIVSGRFKYRGCVLVLREGGRVVAYRREGRWYDYLEGEGHHLPQSEIKKKRHDEISKQVTELFPTVIDHIPTTSLEKILLILKKAEKKL